MDKTASQAEMLANRLRKRFRHLQKWAKRSAVNAFRLYDRDIPEIPLVLDLYGGIVAGALYKRPYEKDEAEETQWLAAMVDSIAHSLGINNDNIIIKRRERQCGGAQYEKIIEKGITRDVDEGKLKFRVNLSNYLDTGLFLDRRAMRALAGADSAGKRVLNLFCYTASFSVYAAAGGALRTDSVDLSNTYLNRARENFTLNGIDTELLRLEDYFSRNPATPSCPHTLIRADVNIFLDKAKAAGQRWDSIIVDPPTFSNSTMARDDFDLRRDYQKLLSDCLTLLSPGGKIWFSVNTRSFKADAAELELSLAEYFPNVTVTDISGKTIDEDFRGKKTPKAFVITL
jgi:23S rRNA G2069 N7-methylase RlmK/C1962 C5-methylase RlmI